jgi:hypothetical protein
VNWKGPPETSQTQSVRMNFRPGSLFQILGVPFPQPRVLGLLADNGVLYDGVAEMIHHRRDGEDAAEPLIQTFLRRRLLGLGVRVIHPGQSQWSGGQRESEDRTSSCQRRRTKLFHEFLPGCVGRSTLAANGCSRVRLNIRCYGQEKVPVWRAYRIQGFWKLLVREQRQQIVL